MFCLSEQRYFESCVCLDLIVNKVLGVRRETEFVVDVDSIDNLLIVMRAGPGWCVSV